MTDIKQYEPLWGSWHVDSRIGKGSFGSVYRVQKEEFGVTYYSAVKMISIPHSDAELRQVRDDGMDSASARSYFHAAVEDVVREVEMMSAFRGNSNIVSLEDHKVIERENEIGWDILIRMELLSNLSQIAEKRTMTPDEVVKLGIHICRALELCALKNVIHRDVKPENIFVSQYGDYKLGDFGIARRIEHTMLGLTKEAGTKTYMAPEVYRGGEYGASVDLYSLGIVMYRFLNKNRVPFLPAFPNPFSHNDRSEAQNRRMNGEPLPPVDGIDDELNGILLKACAFDRAERFACAAEMREALEDYAKIEHSPPQSLTPAEPQRAKIGGEDEKSPGMWNFEPADHIETAPHESTQNIFSPRPPSEERTSDETAESGVEETETVVAPTVMNRLALCGGLFFAVLAALCLPNGADRNIFIFLPAFVFCLAECASRFRYQPLNVLFLAALFLYLSSSFIWTFRYFDYHLFIVAWTLAAFMAARPKRLAFGAVALSALLLISIFVAVRISNDLRGVYAGASFDFVAGSAAMPLLALFIAAASAVLVFGKNTASAKYAAASLAAVQFFPLASFILARLGLADILISRDGIDILRHIANADFIGISGEFFAWLNGWRVLAPILETLAYLPFFALMFARFLPDLFARFFAAENRAKTLCAAVLFLCAVMIATGTIIYCSNALFASDFG
ncbi:MAG: serine/threonine protein kinase [Synergistaceae bacterium]|jgi:serine/threonine protein kinase|nr:serine/threonine protein kinase [Synergistaceae bacterium]